MRTKYTSSPNKEIVNLGQVIGIYRHSSSDPGLPTTWATIHYSKNGAHLVPADPRRR
ncbi:polymorphic toxin type 50 domain-containing protein [Actinotignum sp. GS-2025f]|uniref:polymorphic toxin type 50 domain-containing protein n=1 Tax=unclassified Actinotignum TaxID=2632702 RepID=UPI002A8229A7|nr:polymorphic toxin type 50 domain-containing protein [Actinotignum sp. SLA_B059]MDY5126642.1 polymorphic toxin type 50 domain-containing protein [Actinotignum sp. SLA_B059]